MSYGAGGGDQPVPHGGMLASEVTTAGSTYLVTSYTDYRTTSQAVGAALNTHPSMAAGLRDAVRRMAVIDPGG